MDEAAGREDEGEGRGPSAAGMAALSAASRARADAFLAEQTELTRLQIERERKEDHLRSWLLAISHTSAVLKLAFEFVVALIVVVIGVAVGAALWSAAHDNGLVIEAFSVPPDLAARGLTGDVVAAKVLDRLTLLQSQTVSSRAGSSYVNNWGDDIKVQIPETGVSIGQLYRYLAGWLGHETHISGEIWREDKGLAVTARVAGDPAATLRGPDANLDSLIQQAAEAVYRRTQPYRYAVYLDNHNRSAEATAIYRELTEGASAVDRAWAFIGLSSQADSRADYPQSNALLEKARETKPDILLIYSNLANNESNLQHDERALALGQEVLARVAGSGADASMDTSNAKLIELENRENVDQSLGDIAGAQEANHLVLAMPDLNNSHLSRRQNALTLCSARHDRACYDAALAALPATHDPLGDLQRNANIQLADLNFGDWRDAVARGGKVSAALHMLGPLGEFFIVRAMNPAIAFAAAESRDFKTAHAAIDTTPLDCAQCIRVRARLAAREGDWGAATRWFSRAALLAPSNPTSHCDWGEMLLRKGDLDGAIAKFAMAHVKGLRFADPLELWGEALIAQNRSDLALAKFAEASRYAPNWGRLHLKWGEALLWSGDKAGAAGQFAVAAGLDLTQADRAVLDRLKASRA